MIDTPLLFSDNIVKVNPVPLPPAIDISLKDKSEDNNTIVYGSIKTSSNWISITDTKTDEFNALKQYLNPPSYTATFPITGEQLREIYCIDSDGNPLKKCKSPSLEKCTEIANLINKYSDQFEITDALKMSHFIGQIGAESNGGQLENSYSAAGMLINNLTRTAQKNSSGDYVLKYCDLFEGYDKTSDGCPFPNCDKGIIIPSSDIDIIRGVAYATKNYMINNSGLKAKDKYTNNNPNNLDFFDYVYACRSTLQNCNIASTDGSRFRGRGSLQLTGYYNYKKFQDNFKIVFGADSKDFVCGSPCNTTTYREKNQPNCDKNLNEITTLEGGMQAALVYWKVKDINSKIINVSDGNIEDITAAVNGNQNGISTRKRFTKKAYRILNN
jgi:predicted chitinase